jgi:hypothetical protein
MLQWNWRVKEDRMITHSHNNLKMLSSIGLVQLRSQTKLRWVSLKNSMTYFLMMKFKMFQKKKCQDKRIAEQILVNSNKYKNKFCNRIRFTQWWDRGTKTSNNRLIACLKDNNNKCKCRFNKASLIKYLIRWLILRISKTNSSNSIRE